MEIDLHLSSEHKWGGSSLYRENWSKFQSMGFTGIHLTKFDLD